LSIFYRIDGKFAEITERRETGTEVIDVNLDAGMVKAPAIPRVNARVAHQCGFGDFNFYVRLPSLSSVSASKISDMSLASRRFLTERLMATGSICPDADRYGRRRAAQRRA